MQRNPANSVFFSYILDILFLNAFRRETFKTVLSSFFGTQLNCFTYFYLIRTILFTINHLLIKHQSFVNTHLNDQIVLRGEFNKFPDFFVQAFKIVVDSSKFSMLMLYILWDDRPNFMISDSNEQLQ